MSALSRAAPLARKLLPKSLQRFVLLRLLGGQRLKVHLRQRPSRLFLDREVLPWIATHHTQVLSVGTAPYAYETERLFQRGREHYTTLERDRSAAVWGARTHIVGSIEDIGRHRPAGHFDCIVFNGVFGFGVDTLEDQRKVIRILHDALTPGGLLVVGWNTNLVPDLEALGLFAPYFREATGLPWPHRTCFPLPETHVYDFYARLKDQ